MDQERKKIAVAKAAIDYVPSGGIVGVGTGSTANHFIDALAAIKSRIDGTVASSKATEQRLLSHGIRVLGLAEAGELALYVDGADETNRHRHLIKGGGGALTREKIVAAASEKFICIADDSKLVERLGKFPLPIEVIPMARALVARRLVAMGGRPVWRADFVTDNGNDILDVHDLIINEPVALESELDHIVGVVTNGLFARRSANTVLLAGNEGIQTLS